MRNGNYAGTVTSMHIFDCSYRTYEEWKHFLPINHYNQVKCSYRTYEEWKRVEDWVSQEDVDGSYRTYEEWKRKLKGAFQELQISVLTVPMRNGNRIFVLNWLVQFRFLPYL